MKRQKPLMWDAASLNAAVKPVYGRSTLTDGKRYRRQQVQARQQPTAEQPPDKAAVEDSKCMRLMDSSVVGGAPQQPQLHRPGRSKR